MLPSVAELHIYLIQRRLKALRATLVFTNPSQRLNKLRELTVPVRGGPNDPENKRTACMMSSSLDKALINSSNDHKTAREAPVIFDQDRN